MYSSDPAADWDRHCREQERPYPVGNSRVVRSKKDQHCECCLTIIPAGTPHNMQAQINPDDGLFCAPFRCHLTDDCVPEEDYYL
jgi:hypothetical protein